MHACNTPYLEAGNSWRNTLSRTCSYDALNMLVQSECAATTMYLSAPGGGREVM
jgi:hypothetical protein